MIGRREVEWAVWDALGSADLTGLATGNEGQREQARARLAVHVASALTLARPENGDLARSITTAAAKVIHEHDPNAMHAFEDEGPRYIKAGRATAVAVLETWAAELRSRKDLKAAAQWVAAKHLILDLATEIRKTEPWRWS